jgi:hypothetical protein
MHAAGCLSFAFYFDAYIAGSVPNGIIIINMRLVTILAVQHIVQGLHAGHVHHHGRLAEEAVHEVVRGVLDAQLVVVPALLGAAAQQLGVLGLPLLRTLLLVEVQASAVTHGVLRGGSGGPGIVVRGRLGGRIPAVARIWPRAVRSCNRRVEAAAVLYLRWILLRRGRRIPAGTDRAEVITGSTAIHSRLRRVLVWVIRRALPARHSGVTWLHRILRLGRRDRRVVACPALARAGARHHVSSCRPRIAAAHRLHGRRGELALRHDCPSSVLGLGADLRVQRGVHRRQLLQRHRVRHVHLRVHLVQHGHHLVLHQVGEHSGGQGVCGRG